MSDLVEKIRAAIDEDERAARAWLPLGNPTEADREHIARHDPARVLRQVKAHRKILEIHKRNPNQYLPKESACQQCDEARHETFFSEEQGCPTVLALAEAYDIEVES